MSIVYLDDQCGGTRKTIRLTGVNLQVVNGLGATNGLPASPDFFDLGFVVENGLGNVIIGYDENSNEQEPNGPKKGSHNLIVGTGHVYDQIGGIVAGDSNVAHGYGNAILGGWSNRTFGHFGGIIGGDANTTEEWGSTCLGGFDNEATDFTSVVVGGNQNESNEQMSVVVGGLRNENIGIRSVVVGGFQNSSIGQHSVVSGGANRQAFGIDDWVAGTLLEDN
jgi:hypothetical protein